MTHILINKKMLIFIWLIVGSTTISDTISPSVKIDYLKAHNHGLASKLRWERCFYLEALTGSSSCHCSPKELSKLIMLTLKWLWAELTVSHYLFLCHFLSLHGSSFLICFPTNRAYFFKYVFLLHSIIPVSSDLIGRYCIRTPLPLPWCVFVSQKKNWSIFYYQYSTFNSFHGNFQSTYQSHNTGHILTELTVRSLLKWPFLINQNQKSSLPGHSYLRKVYSCDGQKKNPCY